MSSDNGGIRANGAVPHTSLRERTFGAAERWGLLIFFALLILFFCVDPTTGSLFRSSANIRSILTNQSVTGLVALAMIVPLTAGYFDLAVPAIAAASNIAFASATGHGYPLVVALLIALAVGVALGAVNGYLVAGMRLNGFVVTLGTYTFIGGLVQLYTGSKTLTGVPQGFSDWSSGTWLGVPRPLVLLLVVALVVWYVLMHTPYGRKLESIGSNEEASRLVGVRVERSVFMAFLVSGGLAAVSGILLASRSGVGDATAAPAYLFPALAAVFLGTTTIRPGRYNVWGTIGGVYFVSVAVTGLTLLGAESWVTPVFNGGALVIAVLVSTLMGRRRDGAALRLSQALERPPAEPAKTPEPTAV